MRGDRSSPDRDDGLVYTIVPVPPSGDKRYRVTTCPALPALLDDELINAWNASFGLARLFCDDAGGWKDSPPWLFCADVDPATYDPSDERAGSLDDSNVRRQMRRVLAALPAYFPKWFTPHSGWRTFAGFSPEGTISSM